MIKLKHIVPSCVLLIPVFVGCDDDPAHDRGRWWRCNGSVTIERTKDFFDTSTDAPFSATWDVCANPDVPVNEVAAECADECKDNFDGLTKLFFEFGNKGQPSTGGSEQQSPSQPGTQLKKPDAAIAWASATCNVIGSPRVGGDPCNEADEIRLISSTGQVGSGLTAESSATVRADDESGTGPATGQVSYTIVPDPRYFTCPEEGCRIAFHSMALVSPDVDVDGTHFRNLQLDLVKLAVGTLHSDGSIVMPPANFPLAARFVLDDAPANYHLLPTSVFGHLDHASGKLTLTVNWQNGDLGATAQIVANRTTVPPQPLINPVQQPVECDGNGTANVALSGKILEGTGPANHYYWGYFDPSNQFHPLGTGASLTKPLPLGVNTVDLAAFNDRAAYGVTQEEVKVVDTRAPVVTAPPNVTVECSSATGQTVALGTATRADVCDPQASLSSNAPPEFSFGTTTVTYSSTDHSGNTGSAHQLVTVADTTPPVLNVSASETVIWPPNKRVVRIHVAASATDACTANVPIRLVGATVQEPDGKKPIPSDAIVDAAIGTADFDFGIVADRSGTAKEGRIYTFTYEALDIGGNRTRQAVTVTVPHSSP